MADNRSRKPRVEKKIPESFLIRILKSFQSPPDKNFEDGLSIGKGSILYYPKHVAENMVKGGFGERVFGVRPQILPW